MINEFGSRGSLDMKKNKILTVAVSNQATSQDDTPTLSFSKSPEKPCLVSGRFSPKGKKQQLNSFNFCNLETFDIKRKSSSKRVTIDNGQGEKIRKYKDFIKASDFEMISQDSSPSISISSGNSFYKEHNLNIEKSLDGKLDSANNTPTQILKPLTKIERKTPNCKNSDNEPISNQNCTNLGQIDESQEYQSDSDEDVNEKKQLDDIRNPAENENIHLEQLLIDDSIIDDKDDDSEANEKTKISKKERSNLPVRRNNAFIRNSTPPPSNNYIFNIRSNVDHSNKTIGTVGIQDYSDSDYDSDLDQDYQGFNYNIKVHKKISTSRKSMHSPRIPNKRKNDNTVFNIQPYSTNPSNNQSKSTNILYTSDINGNLKQWNYNLKNFDKNWGQIHTSYIYTMAITKDKGFLFTADRNGNVKQWNLLEEKLEHDWGECHSGPIYSILATSDMNYLITAGRDQCIKKYCLKTHECVKDFGKCHEDWILCMKESSCGQYLFTGSADRQLKQWSIQNESVYHNYGVIDSFGVGCIAVIPAGQFIFTGSDDGHLKQWNISQKKIHKNYKRVHEDCIKAMVATPDSEF